MLFSSALVRALAAALLAAALGGGGLLELASPGRAWRAGPSPAASVPSPAALRPSAAAAGGGSFSEGHARAAARAYSCPILPPSNPLNQDISRASVDANSGSYIAAIGAGGHLHADFGTNPAYGIPYSVVGPRQREARIRFTAYRAESNAGPYPVPANAPVEGAGEEGDRHVLVLQRSSCRLYELYDARRMPASGSPPGWEAASGAVFNLRSNALRPDGWTSADAAGLPIFPLLVRYPEVRAGHIDHALRVTVARTQRGFIHPATHLASSSSDPTLPPMGLRLRLKASFSLAGYRGEALVVLRALRRYGLIVADNGSSWYITGAPDPRWRDEDLNQLKRVPGSAFEAVRTGPILHRG